MNALTLNPFNWFRKEQESNGGSAPALRPAEPVPMFPANLPFSELHREMDRLFDEFSRGFTLPTRFAARGGNGNGHEPLLRPMLDIAESGDAYKVTVELPGVTREDVKVDVVGDTLRISGEKRQESESKEGSFHRIERSYGSFQRLLNLPEDAGADGVEAAFKDGVLTVTIPRKAVPGKAPKEIEVKAV